MSLQLDNILNDISNHKRNRDSLMEMFIEKRLFKSLKIYEKEINYIQQYFRSSVNNKKLIKYFNEVSK